jgi:hypothetical protein
MTKEVTGYKYQVQAAADNAQNALRGHYMGDRPAGNPNGDGKPYTTTEWVSVEFNDGASGTFYYFLGDYAPILGPAQAFDVDVEEI